MRSSVPSPRRTSSPSKTYAVVDGKPKLGGRVRHIHRRAAVHVAAGLRMRRALATAPLDDRSEAIFEADGRLAHAAGQAAYGDVRARLREAVQRIDRARTDAVRREEVEALEDRARRRDILLQFLVEAVVVSLFGGLVGLALGYLVALLIARFGGWETIVPFYAVAMSIGVSVGVGLVFGVGPARRAARLDPVEALRHD